VRQAGQNATLQALARAADSTRSTNRAGISARTATAPAWVHSRCCRIRRESAGNRGKARLPRGVMATLKQPPSSSRLRRFPSNARTEQPVAKHDDEHDGRIPGPSPGESLRVGFVRVTVGGVAVPASTLVSSASCVRNPRPSRIDTPTRRVVRGLPAGCGNWPKFSLR